ncbi:HET-domain-containing protein [Lepidopterella palustris CBS 459.81]|uniref:HET-domain-containing protein n=1 Tax=Lepidopterella palustris CBS 459.81 TaxID=1314670 RepID=A0A8E2DW86_9PEZI|nr:HET-domain-containing protein [Lepidopterella palustris CBS 459.81]
MTRYSYQALNTESEEIRLVRLQPGKGDDQIYLNIFHVSLKQPTWQPGLVRDTLAELQETLPQDRVVKETLDGRYIFGYKTTDITPSSWDHPVQGFDRARYELRDDNYLPGPSYEPEYEALSYTWASELPSTEAYVSGGAASDRGVVVKIELGGNLASALKHLRYEEESRVLWIDAICINQEDVAERNLQVKRMGNIYSFARRVLVWLGPEGKDSTHALSTLQSLASQVELTVDNSLCATPGTSKPDWYHPFYLLPPNIFNDTTWSAIKSLFGRAWFSRVWVIQEVTLANRFTVLHCGGYSLPWLDLKKAIGILRAKESTPTDIKAILDPHVPGIPPPTMRSLSKLLGFVRRRFCQRPHDKVYGILSLVSPNLSSLIKPKYEEPAARVFTNVSLAQLKLTKRLELLQYCSISLQYPDAPSWVPNWAVGRKTVLFGLRTGHVRQASSNSAAYYSLPSDNTLQVAGVRCARVESVGGAAEGDVDQIFDIIRTWEPEGLREDNYQPGGSMLDAFLEAVFQGCLKDRFPRAVSWPTLSELREHYLALLSGIDRRANILKYLRNGVAEAATFFTTKEGYIGVAEQDVNKGDFVCVILGCDMPMLLRPTDESRDTFQLVGICFVPGLLDGESLLGPLPANWKLEMIFRDGSYVPTYINTSTSHSQPQDPRLQPLDPNWAKTTRDRTQDDPYFLQWFQDVQRSRITNSDPRLLPCALKKRGIILEHFKLV